MNILITGATSGIGRQLALDYSKEGHTVWAVGRNRQQLLELTKNNIKTIEVDLLNRDETLTSLRQPEQIDLAILSAGSCEYIDMPHFDSALVARVMRINIETMAHSIEGVLPLLRKSKAPHLSLLGSSAAYLPLPRAEAYGASKAAIAYMADTLRISLYREGIHVSLVCPGFVKTPLTDKNDFPMPFITSTKDASNAIRKGIARKKKEIHFPKRFTYLLKAFSILPRSLWQIIALKMVPK